MLKVKNGKLIASNMSFALPEDFKLDFEMPGDGFHLLEFESENGIIKGGKIFISIEFERSSLTAKESIEELIKDCKLKQVGDFFSVKRGKGTAVGARYISGANYVSTEMFTDYYQERYDFKLNEVKKNQVFITVFLRVWRGKLNKTICDVLELPNVKAFLDSIEYF